MTYSNCTSQISLTSISPDWITAIVAIIALVITMFIALKQISIQNQQTIIAGKQTEIAQQQLEILNYQEKERRKEKGKAQLNAEFLNGDESYLYILRVTNEGNATARNIEILIDGKPAHEYFAFRNYLKDDDIPHSLEKGATWEYEMTFSMSQKRKFNIKITWSDDSGEPGTFDQLMVAR